jgi:hypothetical protein
MKDAAFGVTEPDGTAGTRDSHGPRTADRSHSAFPLATNMSRTDSVSSQDNLWREEDWDDES